MNYNWNTGPRPRHHTAATYLPPALIEETVWDILLAIRSHGCKLSLDKLAPMVSVPQPVLNHWLSLLEQEQLITGAKPEFTHETRAVLTPAGRELFDRYLSAASNLQVGANH